jgi:hypothetical protein
MNEKTDTFNARTSRLAKSINRLSQSARIELLNYHLANGNAWLVMINNRETIRLTLPNGEIAVVEP